MTYIGLLLAITICVSAKSKINNKQASFLLLDNIIRDTTNPIPKNNQFKVIVDSKSELVLIQWLNLNKEDRAVSLIDNKGKLVSTAILYAGSTIVYFETQTLYAGDYVIKIVDGKNSLEQNILIIK
jgi:hypothetical protein